MIVYRSAVAFDGRTGIPGLVGSVVLFAAWTLAATWFALMSLPG